MRWVVPLLAAALLVGPVDPPPVDAGRKVKKLTARRVRKARQIIHKRRSKNVAKGILPRRLKLNQAKSFEAVRSHKHKKDGQRVTKRNNTSLTVRDQTVRATKLKNGDMRVGITQEISADDLQTMLESQNPMAQLTRRIEGAGFLPPEAIPGIVDAAAELIDREVEETDGPDWAAFDGAQEGDTINVKWGKDGGLLISRLETRNAAEAQKTADRFTQIAYGRRYQRPLPKRQRETWGRPLRLVKTDRGLRLRGGPGARAMRNGTRLLNSSKRRIEITQEGELRWVSQVTPTGLYQPGHEWSGSRETDVPVVSEMEFVPDGADGGEFSAFAEGDVIRPPHGDFNSTRNIVDWVRSVDFVPYKDLGKVTEMLTDLSRAATSQARRGGGNAQRPPSREIRSWGRVQYRAEIVPQQTEQGLTYGVVLSRTVTKQKDVAQVVANLLDNAVGSGRQ